MEIVQGFSPLFCRSRARAPTVRVAADGDGDRSLTWQCVEAGSDALGLSQAGLHVSAVIVHCPV